MSGTTIGLFSRRPFDFSQVQAGRCVSLMVVKAVDVSQYAMGTLELRVHERSISGPLAHICVLAYTTAPTGEDPGVDFIDYSSPVARIVIDHADAHAPPVLVTASLAPGFGGMLAIFVSGQQAPIPVAALAAELSAFLTVKS